MNPILELVPIYFKLAHTGQNTQFNVPTNICMKNFIEFAKNNAREFFHIHRDSIIEVVEAGQCGSELRSEDAPALIPDASITFREKYNGRYENIAFYIRVLQ